MSKEARDLENRGQSESGPKSPEKGLDISKYLNREAAREFAKKQTKKMVGNKLDELIAEANNPALAELHTERDKVKAENELIKGYEQIYAGQSDYQLRKIVASKDSKPWQVTAARNVLHAQMKENPLRKPKSKPKKQILELEEEDFVINPEKPVDNRVAIRNRVEDEEEGA